MTLLMWMGRTSYGKKWRPCLEERAYLVKDIKETDQLLRDRMGINLGGQLDMTTAQKIGEVLGVDGVLYGDLMDFDETTTGVYNVRKVRATFKLVNTMTGQDTWTGKLGVKSEVRMSGRTGAAASVVARGSDARDKEVPWVLLDSTVMNESNIGKAAAINLGAKLFTQAVGMHLDYESTELARRVTQNLPWGPGPESISVRSAPTAPPSPKVRTPRGCLNGAAILRISGLRKKGFFCSDDLHARSTRAGMSPTAWKYRWQRPATRCGWTWT